MNNRNIVLLEPHGNFSGHISQLLHRMEWNGAVFCMARQEEDFALIQPGRYPAQEKSSARPDTLNDQGVTHLHSNQRTASWPNLPDKEIKRLKKCGISDIWYFTPASIPPGKNLKTALEENRANIENTFRIFAELGPCRWNYVNFLYPAERRSDTERLEKLTGRSNRNGTPAQLPVAKLSQSEIVFADACTSNQTQFRIIRPPLVLEPPTTGGHEPAAVFSDFIESVIQWHAFVTHRVHDYFDYHPLNLYSREPKIELDILPAEIVAEKVLEQCLSPGNNDRVVTISNKNVIHFDDILDTLCRMLPNLRYEWCHNLKALNRLDIIFHKKIRSCSAFMTIGEAANGAGTIHVDYPPEQMQALILRWMQKQADREIDYDIWSDHIFERNQTVDLTCRYKRRLTYLTFGEGAEDKPVIVLLNAMTAKAAVWKKIIPFFHHDYRIIIPELRGLKNAESFPISDATDFIMETAEDIDEILSHENADGSHLVAWCSGTSTALQYFAGHGSAVRSMTLLAGRFRSEKSYHTEHDQKLLSMAKILNKHGELAPKFLELLAEQATNQISARRPALKSDFFHYVIKQIDPAFGDIFMGRVLEEEALLNYCRLILKADDFDPQAIVQKLNIPCLAIYGDCDHVISPAHSRWLVKNVSRAEAMSLPGATHWLLLENFRETAKKIRRFIDTIELGQEVTPTGCNSRIQEQVNGT